MERIIQENIDEVIQRNMYLNQSLSLTVDKNIAEISFSGDTKNFSNIVLSERQFFIIDKIKDITIFNNNNEQILIPKIIIKLILKKWLKKSKKNNVIFDTIDSSPFKKINLINTINSVKKLLPSNNQLDDNNINSVKKLLLSNNQLDDNNTYNFKIIFTYDQNNSSDEQITIDELNKITQKLTSGSITIEEVIATLENIISNIENVE